MGGPLGLIQVLKSESVKLDGPKVSNWTFQKCQTGRSESIKLDGPKMSNWTVRQYQTGRSKSVKVDSPKVIKLAVQENQALTLISPLAKFHPNPNFTLTLIAP